MADASIAQTAQAQPTNAGDAASPPVLVARDLELVGLPDSRLNLELAPGERWIITGTAGCGKTTLARTLLGLVSPAAGHLALFGKDLDDLAPDDLLVLRRSVALVCPSDGLFPAWSGFDNLALPLRYHGAGKDNVDVDARIVARARAYRLPEAWLEQPVTERGREQRLVLALVRATFTTPQLLIIDGIDLEHTVAAAGIDGEALLADLLAGNPAIIILRTLEAADGATGASGRIPPAFDPPRFRRGRLDAGRLQWLPAQD